MIRSIALLGAAALLVSAGAGLAAVPAPRVSIATFDQLPKPLPLPYDESANGDVAVAAAKAKAIAQHKLMLIDLGGNWCLDCRILAGTSGLPEVQRFLDAHYVEVTVDIGREDKNLQIPARYGVDLKGGVPALLVVDPRTNRLLNKGDQSALEDARHMNPQALADWLAKWIA